MCNLCLTKDMGYGNTLHHGVLLSKDKNVDVIITPSGIFAGLILVISEVNLLEKSMSVSIFPVRKNEWTFP